MRIRLEQLEEKDFPQIVEWINQHDGDFLVQWAGLTYHYPLTAEQMIRHYEKGINSLASDVFIYRIMDNETNRFIGTIQLCRFNRERNDAVIGRFLIGSQMDRGKGNGKAALTEMVRIGFDEFGLRSIRLNVFDCNSRAIRCYESVGFIKGQIQDHVYTSADGRSWSNVEMTLEK